MDGSDGRDTYPTRVTADGTFRVIDLSGTDGTDGRDGWPGEWAQGCYQNRGASNEWGADGGSGGRGGHGGRGGDAGSLTVVTSDLAKLKNLTVLATPGRGGRGGRGGQGGQGCPCTTFSWPITHCSGPNQTQCSTVTYYCTSGSNGTWGWPGTAGREGHDSEITVIPTLEPLPDDVGQALTSVSALSRPFEARLIAKRFTEQFGATALFGAGSRIPDTYRLYEGTQELQVVVAWNAPRPPSDFDTGDAANLAVVMMEGPEPTARLDVLDDTIWLKTSQSRAPETASLLEITVEDALKAQELMQLGQPRLEGEGAAMELVLDDLARVSDRVDTQVDLKLATQTWWIFKKTRFNGRVPAPAMEVRPEGLRIRLSALGIDAKDLAQGKRFAARITINRGFAGHRESKNFNLSGRLSR